MSVDKQTRPPAGLLKDLAYEHIKERIDSGKLVPGDRLSERRLAEELGMSKTPVKAALERLEEQGLITLAPQRSARVKGLTLKEIADLYDFRIALESFIVGRLVGNLDETTTEALRENLELQRRLTTSGDLEDWPEADYVFHLTLARALGNDEITRTMTRLRDQVRWLVLEIARRDVSVPPISCLEHQAIFEHMVEGRKEEAVRAAIAHLEHGRSFVVDGEKYPLGRS